MVIGEGSPLRPIVRDVSGGDPCGRAKSRERERQWRQRQGSANQAVGWGDSQAACLKALALCEVMSGRPKGRVKVPYLGNLACLLGVSQQCSLNVVLSVLLLFINVTCWKVKCIKRRTIDGKLQMVR